MPKCGKLFNAAKNNPKGVRFTEACQLAECYGFVFTRMRGSHREYKRPGYNKLVNLQNHRGMAAEYQVKQILAIIEDIGEDPISDGDQDAE